MKKTLMSLMLPMALISVSIVMSAAMWQDHSGQSGQSGSSSSQSSSKSSSGKMDRSSTEGNERPMILTGCLQAGTEPNTYILTNVSSGNNASSRKGSSGMPGEMARAESSYILVPQSGVDIGPHVGHRVRVTGNLEGHEMNEEMKKEMKSTSGNTGSENNSSSSQTGSSSNMTRFDVKSITQISNTCQ